MPVLQCYGRKGKTKDEKAKRENEESAEKESEGQKVQMKIDFQSRTPTVTHRHFLAELKSKRRVERESVILTFMEEKGSGVKEKNDGEYKMGH